ncbi:MAG: leucyl/phenylalanyl-tRNA--protein transferase [Chitinophagaceae bacterium]|nr:leucyl/phenylalanyl-tRNA--protein transferase [Chitinophagaceae bacterium]
MDLHFLDEGSNDFLSPDELRGNDIVTIGSNLDPETLIKAYRRGYFPWYNEGQPRCWHNPDPRLVLFPEELKIHKSMRPYLNANRFEFTIDKAFPYVMKGCRYNYRPFSGYSSWITDEIEMAYNRLHRLGIAHSAEAWQDGKLVGGLYGIRLGKVFFGESMFTMVNNASKFAFIKFVRQFASEGGKLIDCQQETQHLMSLGARPISRKEFVGFLKKLIPDNEDI